MGSHFHLIVYTLQPTLSAGMRRLCAAYAQWFDWRYNRHGHVFAGRFMSQHITDDAHLLEAHRSIALNPVRAGHCADPADWRWGSYRAIAGLEEPVDFLEVQSTLERFSVRREAARRAYRTFVLGSDPYRGQTPDCSLKPAIHSANSGSTRA
jgi:putative transposase